MLATRPDSLKMVNRRDLPGPNPNESNVGAKMFQPKPSNFIYSYTWGQRVNAIQLNVNRYAKRTNGYD